MRLLFDYGHGGKDPGAVFQQRHEAQDVLKLGQAIAHLVRAQGVTVDETRTTNKTISLQARIQLEHRNRYDLFLSFHRNAFKPHHAQGVEIYTKPAASAQTRDMAHAILQPLVALGFKNRGIKAANFYVLRHAKAPALLLELGFIDHPADNKRFDTHFNAIAQAIAHTITSQR